MQSINFQEKLYKSAFCIVVLACFLVGMKVNEALAIPGFGADAPPGNVNFDDAPFPLDREYPLLRFTYPQTIDDAARMHFGGNRECTVDDIGQETCTYDYVRAPIEIPTRGYFEIEDFTYQNLCLQGDNEVQGARYPECMHHKTTNLYSALDLSEWYLINIQPAEINIGFAVGPFGLGESGPYVGPAYRGDRNKIRYVNRLVQTTPNTSVDTCRSIINPSVAENPYDAQITRFELDSCTNQYILHRATHHRIPVDTQGEQPFLKEGRVSFCQPLRMIPFPEDEQEYEPHDYYATAFTKLLVDSEYLSREGEAPKEPTYQPAEIEIEQPINFVTSYGYVRLNDLAEVEYERINDPSHPFSPRWDFQSTDRELSLFTVYYSYNPLSAVRCSGTQFTPPTVDILNWRAPSFEYFMFRRILFNIVCKYLEDTGYFPCWTLLNGEEDDPPCPTKWDGEEKVEEYFGTEILRELLCSAPNIYEICDHVVKPVAPANPLKLRQNSAQNFPNGVPQGYTFAEYFGNNRPYMRCWDTGLECGRFQPPPDPVEDGQDDFLILPGLAAQYAIMGAGREGESCLIGGSRDQAEEYDPISTQVDEEADPILNWMELKLYQMRAMRRFGLSCLPKHEKLFKVGSSEDMILHRAGGQYQKPIPTVSTEELLQYENFSWPLGWRGYVSDPDEERRFPALVSDAFGGDGAVEFGLDFALPGDILVYDQDVVMLEDEVGNWRNPYVAYVTEINNVASGGSSPPFVKVLAYNHGKFPDACGNTEYWAQGEEFTMYRDGLPSHNSGLLNELGQHTTSCDDPMLSACVEQYWGDVKRYRAQDDVRRGGE